MAQNSFGNVFSKKYLFGFGTLAACGVIGASAWAGNSSAPRKSTEPVLHQTTSNQITHDTDRPDSSKQGEQSATDTQSDTRVTVNGHNIPLPDNGKVSTSLPHEGGQTTVDIDSEHTSSTSGTRSSTNISVFSSTETSSQSSQ